MPYRLGVPGQIESIRLFEQVIAKDASFTPAYAGLATAYAIRSVQFDSDHPQAELAKMQAAAETAIRLDPLFPEAHAAHALVYARQGHWEEAEKSFRRAIDLDSNDASIHRYFAYWFLLVVGRIDEALQQERLAEKADPLSPVVHRQIGLVFIDAGRYDDAAAYCQTLRADDFVRPHCLARARLGQGRTDEAIQILSGDPDLPRNAQTRGFLGFAYARSGQREEAERMAAASGFANEQALIFAGLGDKDRTFEALGRMAVLGPQRIGLLLNGPEFALLRSDQRLKSFRKKVGLPD
jgi:tetratricopeptide (TPR) repeat protein